MFDNAEEHPEKLDSGFELDGVSPSSNTHAAVGNEPSGSKSGSKHVVAHSSGKRRIVQSDDEADEVEDLVEGGDDWDDIGSGSEQEGDSQTRTAVDKGKGRATVIDDELGPETAWEEDDEESSDEEGEENEGGEGGEGAEGEVSKKSNKTGWLSKAALDDCAKRRKENIAWGDEMEKKHKHPRRVFLRKASVGIRKIVSRNVWNMYQKVRRKRMGAKYTSKCSEFIRYEIDT